MRYQVNVKEIVSWFGLNSVSVKGEEEEEEENVFNGVRCDKQPSATNESKLTMMKDSKEKMHPGANMQLLLQSISYDGLHC